MVTKDEIKIDEQNADAELMDRRKALKKLGYRTLSAATMMVLLNTPQAVMATTTPSNPNDTDDGGGGGSPVWQ